MTDAHPVNEADGNQHEPEGESATAESVVEVKKPVGRARTTTVGIALAVVVVVVVLVAVTAMANRQPTTAAAPVSPNQTPQTQAPAQTTSSSTATTPEENEAEAIAAYFTKLQEYVDMSADTFDELPRNERLKYSQLLIDYKTKDGAYDIAYGGGDSEYAVQPVEASTDNSGQEVQDIVTYATQISCLQFEDEGNAYNVEDGRKALSSVYYEVNSNKTVCEDYTVMRNFQETLKGATVLANTNVVKDTSGLMSGTDKDGKKVKYKLVTFVQSAHNLTVYARYIYQEFTSYDGTKKATWLLDTQSLENMNSVKSWAIN